MIATGFFAVRVCPPERGKLIFNRIAGQMALESGLVNVPSPVFLGKTHIEIAGLRRRAAAADLVSAFIAPDGRRQRPIGRNIQALKVKIARDLSGRIERFFIGISIVF